MQIFSIHPLEIYLSIRRHKTLLSSLIKREVIGRYQGSLFGILWSFFNPILMLAVYTFFFSVIFKAKWGQGNESKTLFALVLFAGLIVFNFFSECITRAPQLILSNANYVKKVIFPLEILPLVVMGASLFHCLISFSVWLVFYLLFFGVPHVTIFLFPIIFAPIIFYSLGLSWFLASLGVYIRDVGQMIGVFVSVLMFVSPIFYPVTSLPAEYQIVFLINPLTSIIEQLREVLIWGVFPSLKMFLVNVIASSVVAYGGFAWFQKTRKGFSDVL